MNDDYIELSSGDEKELFEMLLRFKFKGSEYIALRPQHEDESAAIFQIKKTDNDEEIFCTIEDENTAKETFVNFISLWELMQDEE